jgi:hypothetical protein
MLLRAEVPVDAGAIAAVIERAFTGHPFSGGTDPRENTANVLFPVAR